MIAFIHSMVILNYFWLLRGMSRRAAATRCYPASFVLTFVLLSSGLPLAAQWIPPRLDPVLLRHCAGERTALGPACISSLEPAGATASFDQWLSVLGGTIATAVAVDAAGQIYVAGSTLNGLPVTPNAFQPAYPPNFYWVTGFLLKLDPTGSKVLYGTYLNGVYPAQMVVDKSGYIYVLALHPEPSPDGSTVSYPAPISQDAVQTYPGSGITPTLLKIAPSGELVYATFLGGFFARPSGGLAVDSRGSAVVCGSTGDATLPVTPGAFQRVLHAHYDVFAAKISPDGTAYEALTYLGGDGIDHCAGVQLDSDGNVYLYGDTNSRFFPVTPGAYQTTRGAGWNLFAAKLDASMSHLLWSTYIGGDGDSVARPTVNGLAVPGAQSLALAADGSVVFTGSTVAFDYPVSPDTSPPPFPDPISSKPVFGVLDPTGSRLTFSCPLPLVNAYLNSLVTGDGKSFFLVGSSSIGSIFTNATLNAQGLDGFGSPGAIFPFPFLAQIDLPSRSLTYLGPLREIDGFNRFPPIGSAVALDGSLILASVSLDRYTGYAAPVRPLGGVAEPGYGTVIFDLNFSGQTQPLVTGLLNPASLLASSLAPGQIIEIRGMGLGPGSSPVVAPDSGNPPLELAGTQLLIDGAAVPLLAVKDSEILALAPAAGSSSGSSVISVKAGGAQSDPRTVFTAPVSPALFTTLSIGVGPAVATNEDGSRNSSDSPVKKGHVLRLYATGLGAMTTAGDGTAIPKAAITATVSGVAAQVKTIAPAPGYPLGYFAVDVIVPAGAPAGDFLLVEIAANGTPSQPGVTISIR